MYSPSAVQAGELIACGAPLVRPSFVTGRGFSPSASASQRFSTPLRSLRKARVAPSGEKRGWLSNDMSPIIRVASPPATGSV